MATLSKRPRRTKAAGSPTPAGIMSNVGPSCGHGGCGSSCSVRYVGPTSPMHNHHIVNAARGASQVWTAAIVAGLAIVLTGAIAYSAVEAQTSVPNPSLSSVMAALANVNKKLDQMDTKLAALKNQCAPSTGGVQQVPGLTCVQSCTKTSQTCTDTVVSDRRACQSACESTETSAGSNACKLACQATATAALEVCKSEMLSCRGRCAPSTGAPTTTEAAPEIPR